MSKSLKKNPIRGNASNRSEKEDKRLASKALRQKVRTLLHNRLYDLARTVTSEELTSNYSFNKDGKKRMFRDTTEDFDKLLRK